MGKLITILLILYHFYADDTQLLKSINPNSLDDQMKGINSLELAINKISDWMFSNKLQLNKDKTEFLIIGLKKQLNKILPKALMLENDTIFCKPEVRNLGVLFDENLNMKSHINKLCKDCYFQVHNIYKIRPFLTLEAAKSLVHASIMSKIDYCNSLFCGLPSTTINKLQKVQNAAAYLITRRNRNNPTANLQFLHWLPIVARIEFKVISLTYKCLNGLAPKYLSDLLQPYVPTRTLRSATKQLLMVPQWNLKTAGYRCFSSSAPRLWNPLPEHIKRSMTLQTFKKHLKTYLFKKYL